MGKVTLGRTLIENQLTSMLAEEQSELPGFFETIINEYLQQHVKILRDQAEYIRQA